MNTSVTFIRYSLRNRLFVLAVATFLLCAVVILLFFPLLNLTLDGLQNRTINSMKEAAEVEATTIARLLVLEFSSIKGLLQVTPTSNTEMDQWIKNLVWEKVTFNEIIEGVELIQGQQDAQGRHLTYMFYRREAPELEPMAGPQKIMKSFQGLEQDLINSITSQQRVDNAVQGSVNRGPKKEGEMLLRYMPVHVLLADEGAIFWGVAKIGIDTSRMRQLLLLQSQEQSNIHRDIWVEIILSLLISGVLAMSLIYFWVRHITEPLRTLSNVTSALKGAKPEEFDLWLENLKRVDAQGQAEVVAIQEVLERLGTAVPKLGQRLIDGEAHACLGKVMARGLPAFQTWQAQLQGLEQELGEGGATGGHRQTLALMRARLAPVFDDLSHLWSDPQEEWGRIDVTPGLQRAWRLATLGLPTEVTAQPEFAALPPVWGSAAKLSLAVLYLLTFAVELLPPAGELGIKAEPSPAGGVRLAVWVSGNPRSPLECQGWLNPFGDPGRIQGSLGPALAAAIASQHGGSLTVAPREPGGAVFFLELPPLAEQPHEPVI
ncbi:MAG: HAMP domain-containing histidine kinase [Deltaproteobacteria bacterium]|nr:HAMP domain-containing histidine kinase [Deltaproteobacteria bacterium]